tara:strand:- start:1785 stop:2144 length:360 start_codon:yes stop_codon:yes gene_type:complete
MGRYARFRQCQSAPKSLSFKTHQTNNLLGALHSIQSKSIGSNGALSGAKQRPVAFQIRPNHLSLQIGFCYFVSFLERLLKSVARSPQPHPSSAYTSSKKERPITGALRVFEQTSPTLNY